MLANFFDHLKVTPLAGTRDLQVAFSSRDPELAARGANTVADLAIDLQTHSGRARSSAGAGFETSIAALEARVAEADARVESFRAEKGLSENGEKASVPGRQPDEIAASVAEARTAQSDAEARAQGLRDNCGRDRWPTPAISGNDPARRIAEQRGLVRSQLTAESRTLLPAHPRIKALQAQLADIETQLRGAMEKAARGFDNDARAAGARVAALTAQVEEQKRAAVVSSDDAAHLRALQGEARIAPRPAGQRDGGTQTAPARDSADSAPPDARIVSRALPPSQPVTPNKIADHSFRLAGRAARSRPALSRCAQ